MNDDVPWMVQQQRRGRIEGSREYESRKKQRGFNMTARTPETSLIGEKKGNAEKTKREAGDKAGLEAAAQESEEKEERVLTATRKIGPKKKRREKRERGILNQSIKRRVVI